MSLCIAPIKIPNSILNVLGKLCWDETHICPYMCFNLFRDNLSFTPQCVTIYVCFISTSFDHTDIPFSPCFSEYFSEESDSSKFFLCQLVIWVPLNLLCACSHLFAHFNWIIFVVLFCFWLLNLFVYKNGYWFFNSFIDYKYFFPFLFYSKKLLDWYNSICLVLPLLPILLESLPTTMTCSFLGVFL